MCVSVTEPFHFEFGQFYFIKNFLSGWGNGLIFIILISQALEIFCKIVSLIQFHEEICA